MSSNGCNATSIAIAYQLQATRSDGKFDLAALGRTCIGLA